MSLANCDALNSRVNHMLERATEVPGLVWHPSAYQRRDIAELPM